MKHDEKNKGTKLNSSLFFSTEFKACFIILAFSIFAFVTTFTFDEVPPMMEQSGDVSLPLTLFGGRFGKDLDTPHTEFMSDDGISHQREGGLSLNLTYEMTDTNQYKLRAKIM